jgi:hypothetical protein
VIETIFFDFFEEIRTFLRRHDFKKEEKKSRAPQDSEKDAKIDRKKKKLRKRELNDEFQCEKGSSNETFVRWHRLECLRPERHQLVGGNAFAGTAEGLHGDLRSWNFS